MPKDAYWFQHDSNAKDDPKCSMLIEQLGLEGYGIYWVLVETLRDQPGYRYPLNMISVIARKYNTTTEKVRVVVGNYGLFILTDDEFFLSESLCRRMEIRDEIRVKKKIAGKNSGEIRGLLAGKLTQYELMFNTEGTDDELRQDNTIQDKTRQENIRQKNITELQKTILEFIAFRKKIKRPLTDHAIDLLTRELDRIAKTDEEKIAILNQSMLNGWQGVFELKKSKQSGNPFSKFTGEEQ